MFMTLIDEGNVEQYGPLIVAFARELDVGWRCSQAVDADTAPTLSIVEQFAKRDDMLAIVCLDGARTTGYVLAQEGGRCRWAGGHPDFPEVWEPMFGTVRAAYGAVYGRVVNVAMRDSILNSVEWVHIRHAGDPEMIGD